MKKSLGLGILAVLLVGFVAASAWRYLAIRERQAQAPSMPTIAPLIRVKTIETGQARKTVPVLATLKSRASIRLMPEVAGRLTMLRKREGDVVKAGEVIARLESDELQTQLRMAGAQSQAVGRQTAAAAESIRSLTSQLPALKANMSYWQAEATRDRTLYERGALSRAQYEGTENRLAEAKAKVTALEAQIDAARAQMQAVASQKDAAAHTVSLWQVRNRYAELKAPVDGVISGRHQEEGNYVTSSTAIYTLEDMSGSRMLMQVPQNSLSDIRLGNPVRLLDADVALPARYIITRIHPTGNELRQRLVEAESDQALTTNDLERQCAARLVVAEISGLILPAETFATAE
ncbi:MAG TPA: efflux RND transporter periplasmic adaptor subunit, partial [Candidatus Ozemobacteraceae bacterium]|nr:efflux RND transporter periplasmic adaptor subunit [Candidatus Ozemobacteraceae bacterium]